jgi:hypothetical protein
LKQHKPWFHKECLGFLDQRKPTKTQWVQDPRQSNINILNNVRLEARRHFRNNKKEYLKTESEELEISKKIKKVRYFYRASMTLRRVTSLELIQ